MNTAVKKDIYAAGLTAQQFGKMSRLVYDCCGIKMPPQKKSMLEARLRKRLRKLGLASFSDYCDLLYNKEGRQLELVNFIDSVTTNKTDFFRESTHFDFLVKSALPDLFGRQTAGRPIKVWSAGCSSGEEPYTLAIVLNEAARLFPEMNFSITATDISTQVLERARTGVYRQERIQPVATQLTKKYFLRSKNRDQELVRVAPLLRKQVDFKRLNFMDDEYQLTRQHDVIFCRNVIIYFDRETQLRFLSKLISHLKPGGYLFMGHSETLHGLSLPMKTLSPSVYRKE